MKSSRSNCLHSKSVFPSCPNSATKLPEYPKEQTIQILPADGPDEPFDKWMGPGNLGHRLHCFHPQDAQVGLSAVEPEERIMIGTEPRGQTLPADGLVEHAAERGTV